MVTQGEYLGESFPEADHAASLEEGAHLLGEPLPLSVQEDAHTGLPTSPSSSHLCVIKIFNISKSLACLIWPIACATPTIERVWRVHVQSTYYSGKVTKNFVLLLPLLVAAAYSFQPLLNNWNNCAECAGKDNVYWRENYYALKNIHVVLAGTK